MSKDRILHNNESKVGKKHLFHYIAKSGFVRSVFLRVLTIFVIVSVSITAIAFFLFASEIKKNVLSDRKKQLIAIEDTISDRMDEAISIAYNIGTDQTFYTEPIEGSEYSSKYMSDTLKRYLVGNNFIENLAFYRLSEPDTIYISTGERSFSDFFMTSLGLDRAKAEETINHIRNAKKTEVSAMSYGEESSAFFSVLYPLPQMVQNPTAFVLMMIPQSEIMPLFEPIISNSRGLVAAFDADGKEIFCKGTLPDSVDLCNYVANNDNDSEKNISVGCTKFILQKVKSDRNSWTYVSVISNSDTLSGLANKLSVFIISFLLLMFFAILAMIAFIITQYKPINNLAATVSDHSSGAGKVNELIDERVLLSNKIATLTDESRQKQKFETAYHEAESANRAKSVFLSNMSHDIRTPMNAVIGMTSLALRHADDQDYVRECLKKVQVSSQYLLNVINNVLDMSRIESGRLTLKQESIDLNELTDNLVSLVGPSIDAKSQRLKIHTVESGGRRVIGDGVRLTQVFVNIISNAVKFTPEGGIICFDMTSENTDDKNKVRYTFSISDTGIGMSPDFLNHVFDTFTRAKTADDSRTEGTGLGMSIAKNLVELMGGSIICQSELGKGTTFSVILQMMYAEEDEASLQRFNNSYIGIPDLREKKILLVEDNAINREIAHKIIEEAGAEVIEASDGKEAVNKFSSSSIGYYDLILMDLQMPMMNGYQATAEIRGMDRPDATSVLIYAMTANTFDEDVKKVHDSGMNGHIGKPYTPEILYKIISNAPGINRKL